MKFLVALVLTTGCFLNRLNDTVMPPDRFIEGLLTRVDRDERYEASCGVLSRLLGCQGSPRAYEAVVADSGNHLNYFYMFAFAGDSIPRVGTYAFWHLHRREVMRLGQCNSYHCPTDVAYALDSDQDVRRP